MATITSYARLDSVASRDAASPASNWFSRAVARLADNRRLAAERDVARFIRDHGGRLTDDVERQIGQDYV